jgi:NADH dehydrogenase/NADH:ubiquinone oxidoreductase subunit G
VTSWKCDLQDLSFEHGKSKTRFIEEKRTFEPEDIGPNIQLHMNRCILCQRCVQVADQLTDNRVHGVLDRGDHANISTCISKAIDNEFSGNMIDVCPVGALTDKTFRFKSSLVQQAVQCAQRMYNTRMLWKNNSMDVWKRDSACDRKKRCVP